MNPRTVCFCQAIFSMISASVAPLFRWSMATTWAVLVPSRVPLGFDSPLGGFFDRVALVADLASFGATSGDCTPTVASGSAVRAVAGSAAGTSTSAVSALIAPTRGSDPGAAEARSPRPWMAFQMRSVATFRFVNFVTCLTPGRLELCQKPVMSDSPPKGGTGGGKPGNFRDRHRRGFSILGGPLGKGRSARGSRGQRFEFGAQGSVHSASLIDPPATFALRQGEQGFEQPADRHPFRRVRSAGADWLVHDPIDHITSIGKRARKRRQIPHWRSFLRCR